MEFPKKFWLVQRYLNIEPETLQDFYLQPDPPKENQEGRLAVKCGVLASGKVTVIKTVELESPSDQATKALDARLAAGERGIPKIPEVRLLDKFPTMTEVAQAVAQADGDSGTALDVLGLAAALSEPRTVSSGICGLCSICRGCTKDHFHCRACACVSRTWPPTPHRGTITTSHYPLTGDILYTWRGEEPHPFDHE